MLVRTAIATLILALVALVATTLLRPSTDDDGADPEVLLRAFENTNAPLITVDIASIYGGHEELIDPRAVLPSWQKHPRAEAAMVFAATRACPPGVLNAPLADVALAKAYAWFDRTCKGGQEPDDFLGSPPYMHPSGKSYVAMASAPDWKKRHVLELAESGATDERARALAMLGSREWLALLRGDRVVQTSGRIVFADRGPTGLARLRFHARSAWETRSSRFVLVPRSWRSCTRPASSLLCWEATAPHRFAARQRSITAIAAAGAIASVAVIGFAFVRERRRAAMDRLHLLRALTHELRTPAMALGIDIEPFRARYDDVPADLQEPLLRLSSGIARLHRVLHHSARALELFEGKGKLAAPTKIDSAFEMLKDFAAEWPDEVSLTCEGKDGAITTDPEWLGVALRNLVDNACKHGKPPVDVKACFEHGALVIRVRDAGSTPSLSLRDATTAWTRASESGGLGLGLALVARIAKALGGTLEHEPRPTAFVLRMKSKVAS